MAPTPLERRVLDAVDQAEILADLQALVRIPSVDGTPAEHDVQVWCRDRLHSIGMIVDHWRIDLDELRNAPGFPGVEVHRDEAWGCVGRSGSSSPALVLCGHVDVVPAGDPAGWPDRDPFGARLLDGLVHGRGTCDMKAGVAAALGAVAAVRRAGVALREPVAVHTVVGEEDGGIGAFATLLRGHRGAACVIAEPTSAAVVPANAGSLTFRLAVPGRATHGSTRTRGVSAISAFEVVHRALGHLEEERNRDVDGLFAHLDLAWPLSIGIVRSGDWASTVPDRLVAEGRYGVRIDESVEEAKTVFERTVAEACARDPWLRTHPVVVSWSGGEFAPGRLPEGDPLLEDVRLAAEDAGAPVRPTVEGGPYGSDLRHYIGAGIPTVQYGPGEARLAHSAEEYVAVEDVVLCARAFALLVLRRCGVA
jgi:acetylornithine deacetylase